MVFFSTKFFTHSLTAKLSNDPNFRMVQWGQTVVGARERGGGRTWPTFRLVDLYIVIPFLYQWCWIIYCWLNINYDNDCHDGGAENSLPLSRTGHCQAPAKPFWELWRREEARWIVTIYHQHHVQNHNIDPRKLHIGSIDNWATLWALSMSSPFSFYNPKLLSRTKPGQRKRMG